MTVRSSHSYLEKHQSYVHHRSNFSLEILFLKKMQNTRKPKAKLKTINLNKNSFPFVFC